MKWLLVALLAAQANDRIDVSNLTKRLLGFADDNGHYVIVVPFPKSNETDYFFYGDGKRLYQQRIIGHVVDGAKSYQINFWEPRVTAPFRASFSQQGGKTT